MKLNELLDSLNIDCQHKIDVSGMQNDSRKIIDGDVFIAYPGAMADGRNYINQAIQSGAKVVIYEAKDSAYEIESNKQCILIPVKELSKKLAVLAEKFYEYPAKAMDIIGVTGTNGKTTVAYQLTQAQQLLNTKSAYIGTIGQGQVNSLQELVNTTPDALDLQKLFANFKHQAVKSVCMEVSSHALCQHRVDSIPFKQAIYTNLSHEHLDYHGNMEEYANAKARLFAMPCLKEAIINSDDFYHQIMSKACHSKVKIYSYGFEKAADISVKQWKMGLSGIEFNIATPWGKFDSSINAIGRFNLYNSLALISSLLLRGFPMDDIQQILPKLTSVPGRMEIIAKRPLVIVDYAHTPAALENVLKTVGQVKQKNLITVFGCGGDRDNSKRAPMGAIANKYSDIAIITSDNPRTEDPHSIIDDILEGVEDKTKILSIENRKEAIEKAISLADKEDIVVIAGKGHEDYQIIGNTKHPFSDQQIAKALC